MESVFAFENFVQQKSAEKDDADDGEDADHALEHDEKAVKKSRNIYTHFINLSLQDS